MLGLSLGGWLLLVVVGVAAYMLVGAPARGALTTRACRLWCHAQRRW